MEEGPQVFIRFRWQKEQQRGWTLLDTRDPGNAVANLENLDVLYVNLKEFHGFDSNSQPWMQVKFTPGHMEFLRYGADTPYQMKYPESLELLTALVKGRRLLLIGKTNLWEINLEQVSRRLPENRGRNKLN